MSFEQVVDGAALTIVSAGGNIAVQFLGAGFGRRTIAVVAANEAAPAAMKSVVAAAGGLVDRRTKAGIALGRRSRTGRTAAAAEGTSDLGGVVSKEVCASDIHGAKTDNCS